MACFKQLESSYMCCTRFLMRWPWRQVAWLGGVQKSRNAAEMLLRDPDAALKSRNAAWLGVQKSSSVALCPEPGGKVPLNAYLW